MVIEPVGSATEQLAVELSTAAAAVSALLPKMVAAEAAASSQLASNATTTAWEFGWKRNETGCDTKDIPTASVVSCRQRHGRGFLCLNFRSFSEASACIFAGVPVQANQATTAAPNDDGAGAAALAVKPRQAGVRPGQA